MGIVSQPNPAINQKQIYLLYIRLFAKLRQSALEVVLIVKCVLFIRPSELLAAVLNHGD